MINSMQETFIEKNVSFPGFVMMVVDVTGHQKWIIILLAQRSMYFSLRDPWQDAEACASNVCNQVTPPPPLVDQRVKISRELVCATT